MPGDRERTAQKARTREALLAAARALLAEGAEVTVAGAARRAGMSKATAYRYFSDPAALALEAGLDHEVLSYEEIVGGGRGLRGALMAVTLYFFDLALEHEAQFRRFLARALDVSVEGGAVRPYPRGARRIAMLERALAEDPEHGLSPPQRVALVRALAAVTGIEAAVALRDVVQVTPEAARAVVADMTAAVLDRYLPPDQ
ncbi:TetR family transcriptional regulator [Rhodobacteraceae bacterium CCMM004]|nr:TetR family transcriptional regulator [Rhodobacteraceae bacterium CCMM004]